MTEVRYAGPMTLTYAWRDGSTVTYFSGGKGLMPMDCLDRVDRAILRALVEQVIESLDAEEGQ